MTAPPRPALALHRARLERTPALGQLVAAIAGAERGFLLAGRWGLPLDAPGDQRVVVAGVDPDWVVPPGADPFVALDQVDALRGAPADGAIGGGLVGTLGFELSRRVEPSLGPQPPRPTPLPAASLAWYGDVLRRDPQGTWWVEALLPPGDEAPERFAAIVAGWRARLDRAPAAPPSGVLGPMRIHGSADGHRAAVRETIERIYAGELFQANVCLRLSGRLEGQLAGLVEAVLQRTDPWHGGWIWAGDDAILSASPELFLRRRGHEVITAPIKGTVPRLDGALIDPHRDPAARELLRSVKDRAEHVMIVDLMRNDLGRVCDYGSIRPDDEPVAEPHAGVWHLVSRVRGALHEGFRDGRLVRATFPPGSVTGAPKVQALRVIAAVEGTGRETYTGAHGLLSPVSGLELAVTIRTLEVRGRDAWLGVGGGIVADSTPQAEFDEALGKAAALVAAAGSRIELVADDGHGLASAAVDARWLPSSERRPDPAAGLIETVAVREGSPVRLAAHLDRLGASAAALGLTVPSDLPEQIRAVLDGAAGSGRLRIELTAQGTRAEVVPFSPVPAAGLLLSPIVVPGGLGPHKWRDRALLDRASAAVPGTPLLLNADGTLLEAAWASVWWEASDGRLRTPLLDGRILPGVTRAALLHAAPDRCAEGPAPALHDVRTAPLLVSSARGLTPAFLESTPEPARQRAAQLAAELAPLLA